MLADSVDPDQIALEQCDQGLHRLPVILLNAHNTLIQIHIHLMFLDQKNDCPKC